ncbi:translin-associated protein X-like [Tubulanus polymorphus]|uniref:translin-associated protein X-like n=1 Tax=Tubulanus polymorphus TaxID=672921 RepID=UPI003DA3C954
MSYRDSGQRRRRDWRQKDDSHRGEKKQQTTAAEDSNSPVIQAFIGYRKQLDNKHDKYERLVKLSRDITIDSKRTIFLLQRITGNEHQKDEILLEAAEKLEQIQKEKFQQIADELFSEDAYQFLRAYSPGLQEYIEALSFYWYWKHGDLVDLTEVEKALRFNVSNEMQDETEETAADESVLKHVTVPPIEYILGVADLTGELMRCAIHSVGNGDLDKPFEICAFLRRIHDAFLSYGNSSRELPRKMSTLRSSLNKVEQACYTLQVRGSEFPKHMLIDLISKPVESSDFNDEVYYD